MSRRHGGRAFARSPRTPASAASGLAAARLRAALAVGWQRAARALAQWIVWRLPRLALTAARSGVWVPGNPDVGRLGEALVAAQLRRAGWNLLARRVQTAAGELDLLARRGNELRVIEVKTARRFVPCGPFGDPLERVSPSQLRRLERAAGLAARRLGCDVLRLTLAACWLELPRGDSGESDRRRRQEKSSWGNRARRLLIPARQVLVDHAVVAGGSSGPAPTPGRAPNLPAADAPSFTPRPRPVEG